MTENWRDIKGFEGRYQVSDFGNVRSLPRISKGRRQFKVPGCTMTPSRVGQRGYLKVVLCAGRATTHRYVHHLVLETFVGPCPPAMEACHFPDPDVTNCKLSNLRWDTRSGNRNDSRLLDRLARGERHGRTKLIEADVIEIFAVRRNGMFHREIASQFGISMSQVNRILTRKNWGHINV